jgi:putative ABC transport system permease protein
MLGITPNVPELLGVRPLIGRTFRAGEGTANGGQFALLGEEYWRRRFNADPAVLGRSLLINDVPITIVGVLPAEADLGIRQIHAKADYGSPLAGAEVELWTAFESSPERTPRSTHPFLTIGRLAPGATLQAAQAELARIMADIERGFPENAARGVNLEPYELVTFGPVRPALLVLLGAVALVLLVACVNVANLLLARTAVRSREVAVRRALGAATGRITRQFLVESLVLTGAGALAGVLLAQAGLKLLVALAPTDIPRLTAASIDVRVLGFTALVSAIVALGFGMTPAFMVRRLDLQSVLKAQSGRSGTEGHDARRFRAALVVAEIALAVTLVIGAGVLLRSFWKLASVDPGFRSTSVLKVEYQLPSSRYQSDRSQWPVAPAINGFHDELLRRVRALPGVQAAALATRHPLDPGFTNSFVIIGREAESHDFPEIRTRFISPGYIETMGVPLVAGRAPNDGDVAGKTPVGVINRAAAEAYFAGRDPIGQQLRFWGVTWQIVGVIGDERFKGLAQASEPAIYSPIAQAPGQNAVLLVRTPADRQAMIGSVRRIFQAIDPQLAIFGVEPLEQTLSASIAKARFTSTLLALFAGVAILLALVGVHGVLSYTVAQRGQEVGIRMALGATRSNVIGLVVGEGARLAALGTVIGLAAALAGSQLLAGLVFGVTPRDLTTFVAVTIGVLSLAGLASWLPAQRAARADPMRTLRSE